MLRSLDPAERDLGNTLREQWRAEKRELPVLKRAMNYDVVWVKWEGSQPFGVIYGWLLLSMSAENSRWKVRFSQHQTVDIPLCDIVRCEQNTEDRDFLNIKPR